MVNVVVTLKKKYIYKTITSCLWKCESSVLELYLFKHSVIVSLFGHIHNLQSSNVQRSKKMITI